MVSAAVVVAVLLVVFAGIFPKVADSSQAWASIQEMPTAFVVQVTVTVPVPVLLGALTFLWWRVTAARRPR